MRDEFQEGCKRLLKQNQRMQESFNKVLQILHEGVSTQMKEQMMNQTGINKSVKVEHNKTGRQVAYSSGIQVYSNTRTKGQPFETHLSSFLPRLSTKQSIGQVIEIADHIDFLQEENLTTDRHHHSFSHEEKFIFNEKESKVASSKDMILLVAVRESRLKNQNGARA